MISKIGERINEASDTDSTPSNNIFAIAEAIPKIIIQTASSIATTGNNVSTNGPLALYCLTTIKVAAGAVAEPIAPNTILKCTGCLKMKIIPRVTHRVAPIASKKVIKTTPFPIFFKCSIFKSLPIL